MAALEFWFEFASTYSYPAAHAVEAATRERGVEVKWRSFLLGPIFAAQGWNDSPFNIYPAKGRYMWRDLARICAAQGLALKKPSQFPRGSLLAARIACRFADAPWIGEFVRRVYSANFADDLDIGSPFVIGKILADIGQTPAPIMQAAQAQETKDAFRAQADSAVALGIVGAPSFVVDGEIFWGGDRLAQALDWAQGRRDAVAL
jgi:2-hydroxychromene-2-carboxylate isomerase